MIEYNIIPRSFGPAGNGRAGPSGPDRPRAISTISRTIICI